MIPQANTIKLNNYQANNMFSSMNYPNYSSLNVSQPQIPNQLGTNKMNMNYPLNINQVNQFPQTQKLNQIHQGNTFQNLSGYPMNSQPLMQNYNQFAPNSIPTYKPY